MRVTIIGAARSGIAAANLAMSRGAVARISDAKTLLDIEDNLAGLTPRAKVAVEAGGHTKDFVIQSDLVVASPGVWPNAEPLKWAREAGIPVIGEIEFSWRFCTRPVIAVTGSNGKTTTVTLITKVLEAAGKKVALCGNIGAPFAEAVRRKDPVDIYVVEISSFQLELCDTFRPHVAVLLNFSPNHLDRHPTMQEYFEAKKRLFINQTADDFAILNAQDKMVAALAPLPNPPHQGEGDQCAVGLAEERAKISPLPRTKTEHCVAGAEECCPSRDERKSAGGQECRPSLDGRGLGRVADYYEAKETSPLPRWEGIGEGVGKAGLQAQVRFFNKPGETANPDHLAVLEVARILGVKEGVARKVFEAFPGVEHRTEKVKVLGGVTYINDSKATTAESGAWALRLFQKPIIMIAGGHDKGPIDFSSVVPLAREKVKKMIVLTKEDVVRQKLHAAFDGVVPLEDHTDMKDAVRSARAQAVVGDHVLLSPMFASFDMFSNFEHRGQVFKEIVKGLE